MNIYEIDNAIQELLANSVDAETGELMIDTDALDALQMERDSKIENVACYIKNLSADVAALKAEENALAERRKATERKIERLKAYLADALNGQKFQTAKCAVSFRKTPSVEIGEGFIEWAEKNNEHLLRYKEPEANKVLIKKLLIEGAEIPNASLVENTSMTIK